ncbi:MAG: ATP-binding protein [Vicinamibacteria bacterium]|nr:ATP-binding protein [Vicinamibacteria bacterium]
MDYEKLGLFYLGRPYDLDTKSARDGLLLYDSKDLVTHAVCVGMTGSGKTGLCIDLLEEAAIDGIPALAIDPKGDLGNLLLTFPDLSPGEFRPWIDEDEARRNGKTPEEWAASEADTWRKGLESWGQSGDRIKRLRAAVDVAIYTPGAQSGLPLSIVKSFSAPAPDFIEESDLMRERVATTATSLLGLLGIDADPIKSREHILLSTIIDSCWRQGEDFDLARLIQMIQTPPVQRIGVLELEAFYPSDKRFELAMAVNNLLAAPGFSAWMEGEALDVQRLLYTPEGKPRLTILSIAHLNDAERMFFVSLLLNQVLGWMRQQPGTTSLRAIVYMDEIAGYLPPVANPASKAPMLTLLKQARAFGVGMVLATQNPVDLDYKALSNAGTWFIGRLQTERDQMRVLDGLEGAMSNAGGAFDRDKLQRLIGGLGKRVFLLHNVHEDGPEVFESRWAMSYLRGPLTRTQIRTLMAGRKATAPDSTPAPPSTREHQRAPESTRPAVSAHWVLPPGIPQYFAPARAGAHYVPMIVGAANVRFTDTKAKIDSTRPLTVVTPLTADPIPVTWDQAQPATFEVGQLSTDLPSGATFDELPGPASKARNYADWTRSFVTWVSTAESLDIYRSPSLEIVSNAGESEGDFRARLQQAAREQRDAEVTRLRQKFAPRAAALQERLRRAEQAVEKEEEQASAQKTQTAISFGTTVLGALFGRKSLSASTLGRATTAVRGVGRASKEAQDVTRAKENVGSVQSQMEELDAALQAAIASLDATYHPATEPLETISLKPMRTGIQVKLVALVWVG